MSGIQDRLIGWKARTAFWKASTADDVIGTAGADTGQNGGGPVVAVASDGSGLGVVQMAANGDEVTFFRPIFHNWDRASKVLARIWFIHSSTDADTPIFTVKTKFHAKQVTVVDMDTADDASVAFAAHTCGTTNASLEVTDWTDLQWNLYVAEGDVAVGLILQCSTISASADEVELYGIEFAYEADETRPQGANKADFILQEQQSYF